MAFVTLQTTTFKSYGGIPAYNRLVCRVLNGIDTGYVLIAQDKPEDLLTPQTSPFYEKLSLEAFAGRRRPFLWRLTKLIAQNRIELLLIGHVNYAPLGWMLKRLQPKLLYGVMLYGIEAWQQLPPLRRRALQQADFIISISDYTRQRAVEVNSLAADRIYLLPNALELGDIVSTPGPSRPGAGTRILSVCRLDQAEQYKGVDKVIEILPKVVQRVPDIQYIVIGGGSDLQRHRRLAHEMGLSERVHFLGFVGEEALLARYRECDLFVMPSAGEGFGFVFLEAMKYGKAVVAANSGGTPEVVQDGITGCLVQYGDKDQLAETLINLCLDQNKRRRLGQAGFQLLQEKFTFPHFKQKLTEILIKELAHGVAHR